MKRWVSENVGQVLSLNSNIDLIRSSEHNNTFSPWPHVTKLFRFYVHHIVSLDTAVLGYVGDAAVETESFKPKSSQLVRRVKHISFPPPPPPRALPHGCF